MFRALLARPLLAVIIIGVLTAFFASFIPSVQYDNEVSRMIPADNPNKVFLDRVQKEFGLATTMIVGIVSDDSIYRKDLLEKVVFLTDTFETLDHVTSILSLSRTNFLEGDSNGLVIGPIMDGVPETEEEMHELKRKLMSWDVLKGSLVSEDGRAVIIGVQYELYYQKDGKEVKLDEPSKNRLYSQIEAITAKTPLPNARYYIAGEPVVMSLISRYMERDVFLLLPIVSAVVVFFLYISLGSLLSVGLIFLAIAFSLAWTIGIMSLLNVRISLVSTAIPVLLVAIGSAYAIHIIHRFTHELVRSKDRSAAVQTTVQKVGRAVLMAALTTMAGFGSLATSDCVPIREFGTFMAIGTFSSLLVSLVFVPAVLVLAPGKWSFSGGSGSPGWLDGKLGGFLPARVLRLSKNRVRTIALSVFVLAAAVAFSFRIHTDNDMIRYFKKGSVLRKADAVLNRYIGGTSEVSVYLESRREDVFRDPAFLKLLREFQKNVQAIPGVGKVAAFTDYICRLNRAMNGNNPAFDRVPDSRELIAQYLLLVSYEDYESMVDEEFQKGKMAVQIKQSGTNEFRRIIAAVRQCAPKGIDKFVRIRMTGTADLLLTVDRLVVSGQIRSIVVSITVVFLLSALVFRSLLGGLLTILPLTLAVMINFGIMGLLGIPLEVGTAIIACVAIGVGVDYAIHYINAVKNASAGGAELTAACVEGAKMSGSAIIFNALSVGAGFLVLNLSSFIPLIHLGSLISFTMLTTSYATLTVLPVVIMVVKPGFLRKN